MLAALVGCQPKLAEGQLARVNHDTITQRDLAVAQQLWPQARNDQPLERAIDRSLAAQKAVALGLHREPWVQERLEAMRAEVLRQALRETVQAEVPALAEGAVQAYYNAHPLQYAQRRLYNLRRLEIEVQPERVAAVKAKVLGAKHLPELMAQLKADRYKVQASQMVVASPELPLAFLQTLAGVREGQMWAEPTSKGVDVWWVVSARLQPISLARAEPEIEAYLIERWRKARWQQELASLRATARIERRDGAWLPAAPGPSVGQNGVPRGALAASQPMVLETH